jgi:hypothetical protein
MNEDVRIIAGFLLSRWEGTEEDKGVELDK